MKFSLNGLIRFVKLKLTGKEILIAGGCRRCGACCRKVNLDISGRWVKSVDQYAKMIEENPDYSRFEIIGKDKDGHLEFTCNRLQADGSCGDYEDRPTICRDFPDKRIFFMNGSLPKGCGFSIGEGVSFKKELAKVREKAG